MIQVKLWDYDLNQISNNFNQGSKMRNLTFWFVIMIRVKIMYDSNLSWIQKDYQLLWFESKVLRFE